jgi:hypothetical protein
VSDKFIQRGVRMTLICYDTEQVTNTPEAMVEEMGIDGFRNRGQHPLRGVDIRCDLVAPTEEVGRDDLEEVFDDLP